MTQKEIIVLSGGGHKGVVKLTLKQAGTCAGSCSVDFRPHGARLYLVGDNIAEVELYDLNSTFEVPFSATNEVGCVVRSSSLTMFGGGLKRSDMLRRLDERAAKQKEEKLAKAPNSHDAQGEIDALGAIAADSFLKYDGNNFYYAVKPQLDEMFVCYPHDELLEGAVQNSKWVRIDGEDGYYVVGVLYDDKEPSFICYGVPERQKNASPPSELENMCVWLSVADEGVLGYWLIYQSAKTGEIIK